MVIPVSTVEDGHSGSSESRDGSPTRRTLTVGRAFQINYTFLSGGICRLAMANVQRVSLFVLLASVTEMVLVAVSWRLWFGVSEFPSVPVASFGIQRPAAAALFLMSCGVLSLCSYREWRTGQAKRATEFFAFACVAFGGLSVVLNLHCLQAWHWLFLLICGVRLCPAELQGPVLRTGIAGIYLFAGLSRFGFPSGGGMTQQIVQWWCDTLGHQPVPAQKTLLCHAANVMEFCCGLLLLFPRTRRLGVGLATLLHFGLLIALGPWGLAHNQPVLIWNFWFLLAIPLLFWPRDASSLSLVKSAVAIIALLPGLAGACGWIDAWPGWQLYSPQPGSAQLFVQPDALKMLPRGLQEHVGPPSFEGDWCAVRVDDWSLEACGAAIYPDEEFQAEVIVECIRRLKPGQFRVVVERPQRPRWWRRDVMRSGNVEDLPRLGGVVGL